MTIGELEAMVDSHSQTVHEATAKRKEVGDEVKKINCISSPRCLRSASSAGASRVIGRGMREDEVNISTAS